jgi:signal transduction histidine kinase
VHAQARREVERLRGVAEDLTLFAAPPRLALGPLDLADLCREAAECCAGLVEDMGARLDLSLPAEPLPVRADHAKLLSALLNLVRNGLEAVGPGAFGEPLGAPAARERRVLVAARRQAGEAVLEVSDTGPGIAPEIQARLFEPFVSSKRNGTGLGLAIARRVAVAHGGRIEATAGAGGGAMFRIALPLGPAAAAEGARAAGGERA